MLTQSRPHAVAAPRAASEACADSRWVRDPRHWCHRSGCRPRGFMRRAQRTLWADGRRRRRCSREARSSCSSCSWCEFACHGFQWRCELLRVGYQLHPCLQQPLQSPPRPARAAHPFPSCLGERSNAHRLFVACAPLVHIYARRLLQVSACLHRVHPGGQRRCRLHGRQGFFKHALALEHPRHRRLHCCF